MHWLDLISYILSENGDKLFKTSGMFVSCVISKKEVLLPFTGRKLSKNRPFSAANEHLPSLAELMGANITTRHWRRGTKAVNGHQSGSQCSSPWTHEHKPAENEADE